MPADTDQLIARLEAIAQSQTPEVSFAGHSGTPLTSEECFRVADALRDVVMTDVGRAVDLASTLRRLATESGFSDARVRASAMLVHALTYATRFDDALSEYTDAMEFAGEDRTDREVGGLHLAAVQPLARLGKMGEAIEACAEAERLFLKQNERDMVCRAMTNRGVLLRMSGKNPEAIDCLRDVASHASEWPEMRAQILSNLGEALLDGSQFTEAEAAFRESAGVLDGSGMTRVACIVRGNLADLLARQGRLNEAIDEFERVRLRFEQEEAVADAARIESEIAELYATLGTRDQAETMYARCVPKLNEAGLVAECARAKRGYGALLASSDVVLAEAMLTDAASVFASLGRQEDEALTYLILARLSCSQTDLDAASHWIQQSERTGTSPLVQIAIELLGSELSMSAGEVVSALAKARSAAKQSDELHLPELSSQARIVEGRALLAMADPRSALEALELALRSTERARDALLRSDLRAAYLGAHAEPYSLAARAHLALGEPDRVKGALTVLERSRSRSLLDLAVTRSNAQDTGGEASHDLDQYIHAARANVRACFDKLSQATAEHNPKTWAAEMRAAERSLAEHVGRREHFVGTRAAVAQPLSAEHISERLSPGTGLAFYAAVGDELHVFALRDGSLEHKALATSTAQIEELTAQHRFQLKRALHMGARASSPARMQSVTRTGHALFRALLEPIDAFVHDVAELTIVPTNTLHGVSFPSLFDGEKWLIERSAVNISPSATFACGRGGIVRRDGPAVVVGCPDLAAPELGVEAEAIGRSLPSARVLLGEEATFGAIQPHVPHAGIFHLATHGLVPPGSPLASSVKLADGWVTARELAALDLAGCSVVLSGCDLAQSDLSAGEPMGMVQVLLVSGASEVLASLWPAHDTSSRRLMVQTYQHYAASLDSVDRQEPTLRASLRHAQLAAIRESQHPGLWAGFVGVGPSQFRKERKS